MNEFDSLAGPEEPLDEQVVQLGLFYDLLDLESELRGGACMSITRSGDGAMCCKVYMRGESKARVSHRVRLCEVRCARQIMDEVARIYSSLLEAGLVDGKEESDDGGGADGCNGYQ